MATLHTDSAICTVNRPICAFPPAQQDQARTMLAESLRGVVSQRLLPKAVGSGLVPATEILFSSKAVGKMIRDNRTFQIGSVLQTGGSQGMWQHDESLATLVRNGVVSAQDAIPQAEDPKRITGPDGGG